MEWFPGRFSSRGDVKGVWVKEIKFLGARHCFLKFLMERCLPFSGP